eukprot:GILJ01005302.1.p1 GENE.GILJ01005302.1~~GILJ01005302.1.p1  ORF type:complete len:723 (-),score=144.13 GILJ01005302.1:98-2182(-)
MKKPFAGGDRSRLEVAIESVKLLIQQKMLLAPRDEVGLVLFGTEESENELHAADGGYEHVTTAREINVSDLDFLKFMDDIGATDQEGDFLDGLVVGLDALIKRVGKKAYSKRVFLITDGESPVAGKGDVPQIVNQLLNMEARFNVIGVDFPAEDSHSGTPTQVSNVSLLRELAAEVHGAVLPCTLALSIYKQFRARSVGQVAKFKGPLEIGEDVKIPVIAYTKTREEALPSLKKQSIVSMNSANPDTMAVKMDRSYIVPDDEQREPIDPEQRVKGYKYGKQMVPFSKADEAVLKMEVEKGLQILGFTDKHKVPRHHYMAGCDALVADPSIPNAAVALSSLIHGLVELDRVAIARFVARARASPKLVMLFPHISARYECLFVSALPFAEDIRDYTFSALPTPSSSQLEAADRLVRALDLMVAAEDDDGEPAEALKPKMVFNPVLQRFYQCIQNKALHPDQPLPPLDPNIAEYLMPDATLLKKAEKELRDFASQFTLTKGGEKKSKRKFWREVLEEESEANKRTKAEQPTPMDTDAILTLESVSSSSVRNVGTVDPVTNFKKMLSDRRQDLVSEALSQMKEVILKLVEDSIRDQLFSKASDCVQALRDGCVAEGESKVFNEFLQSLKSTPNSKVKSFWEALRTGRKITLISSEESRDSDVSPRSAQKFIESAPMSVAEPIQASAVPVEEDLLADIE